MEGTMDIYIDGLMDRLMKGWMVSWINTKIDGLTDC
jgi:hypothetical protein